MERFELHIEAESRIRWKVYVRFGGEFSKTDHSNMARRRLLSLHYKYPDLSEIAYNHLRQHLDAYPVKPQFFVINFDDPRRSHHCNPIHPDFMTDISNAYEAAYTIMLNLNKTSGLTHNPNYSPSSKSCRGLILAKNICTRGIDLPSFAFRRCRMKRSILAMSSMFMAASPARLLQPSSPR